MQLWDQMVLVNQHYHQRLWDIHHTVTQGEVLLDGVNILELEVDERAKAGLFLAMQYPSEITGVTNADFMRSAINAKREEGQEINLMQFIKN